MRVVSGHATVHYFCLVMFVLLDITVEALFDFVAFDFGLRFCQVVVS